MKLNNSIRIFLVLFAFGCIIAELDSCNQSSGTNSSISSNGTAKNATTLPDSIFALKNIKNSNLKLLDGYDGNPASLLNNSNIKFKKIDTLRFKKIVEFLDSEFGGLYYFFISKQEMVEDYQPIIVEVNASHYSDLVLIILDKNNTPLSYLILNEGTSTDNSISVNDSMYKQSYCSTTLLERNEIRWYKIDIYYSIKSIKLPDGSTTPRLSWNDSIEYMSTLLANGSIETKKIDSVRLDGNIPHILPY